MPALICSPWEEIMFSMFLFFIGSWKWSFLNTIAHSDSLQNETRRKEKTTKEGSMIYMAKWLETGYETLILEDDAGFFFLNWSRFSFVMG